MNIGELISGWKEDFSWVRETQNPFLKKDVWILPNPVTPTEAIIYLSITDNTLFVNGMFEPFYKRMQFVTFGHGEDSLNKDGDAARLKFELEKFTNTAIQEREEQIKGWEDKGMKIETTNPFMWKDSK